MIYPPLDLRLISLIAGIWLIFSHGFALLRPAAVQHWLRKLPRAWKHSPVALVHASPESCWQAPAADAPDAEFESTYGSLREPFVVYGHTHRPFIRRVHGLQATLINTGSVGLSYDGDPRASYLLLDEAGPTIRRVEYDVARELAALSSSGLPGAEWTAKMIRTASPQMP